MSQQERLRSRWIMLMLPVLEAPLEHLVVVLDGFEALEKKLLPEFCDEGFCTFVYIIFFNNIISIGPADHGSILLLLCTSRPTSCI